MATQNHAPVTLAAINTNLYIFNNVDKCEPLPEWGKFFIEIGRRLVEYRASSNRLVVALAVPTRSFAAAFSAFGIVIARAGNSNNQVDINKYFEKLCRLKPGTSIFYRQGDEILKGTFIDVSRESGHPRFINISVDTKNGHMICKVPLGECQRVDVAIKNDNSTARKTGRYTRHSKTAFVEDFFDDLNLINVYKHSDFTCAILGKLSVLKKEILETSIVRFSSDASLQKGKLQDILRVRKWLSKGEAYRSDVFPVNGDKPQKTLDGLTPHITIFDGASGFLKWRENWLNSHWIVLLDRTEPKFKEAVELVNYDYIQKRVDEGGIQNMPPIPPGVEIVIYQEARQ